MNPTQTTVNSRILTELLVSIIAAFVVTILVEKIPGTEGRLPYIPINALLFLVVPLVFFMLWQLVDSFKSSKKTLATFVLVVSVYSLVIYLIAIDTGTEVVFNAQILKGLTIPICLVAGLPFVVEQSVVCFEQSTARRDAIYFAATVMWLSPLIAELLIMLRWYFQGELWNRLSYMVLGAMGTKDILFFYGFWAFLAMVFFRFFEHK